MSDDEGPPLIRPVARRPFTFICQSPSPSDHELSRPQAGSGGNDSGSRSSSSSRTSMATTAASSLGLNLHHNLGLGATLAAWDKSAGGVSSNASEQASPAISRPASFMNLTSSTLYGIYAPTVNTTDATQSELIQDSPWDMGAQTPIRRPDMDDECQNLELMREQFHVKTRHFNRRRSLLKGYGEIFHPYPAMSNVQLALRTIVLFVLGLGYGTLVTRLHNGNMSSGYGSQPQDDLMGAPPAPGELNLKHLTAWGVAGVVLGSLLPWFDGIWETRFGSADEQEGNCSLGAAAAAAAAVTGTEIARGKLVVDVGLDWVLVMRAIGAFVGIAFAIRKLAWSSTMQIAATLALVNPLLWWLIDRSKAGFVLSAAVGLVGSALLLGISPDMMPTPAAVVGNMTMETTTTAAASLAAARVGGDMRLEELRKLVGHHNAKTLETGVWMLSVLFCSCLCFGNIGRRLFLSRATQGPGRWGGVR